MALIISLLSVVLLVLGGAIGPWVLLRLPADFFVKQQRPREASQSQRVRRVGMLIVRNVAGASLVFVGVALLVLPGQGLLTMVFGLLVMDFPARRRLLRRGLQSHKVRNSINRLRTRFGREPFDFGGELNPNGKAAQARP